MASKTPIEAKMVSWFALAPADEARKQFTTVRAVLADRGLLGRGKAKAGARVSGKRAGTPSADGVIATPATQ